MTSANRFSVWFDGELAPWAIDGEGPFPYVDLPYWSAVCQELDRLLPAAGLHVVATTALTGRVPGADPSSTVLLCLGDEFAVTPDYAHDVRLVAKTMGGRRRRPYLALRPASRWPALPVAAAQEAVVQARRAPYLARSAVRSAARRRRARVLDVPIGIRAFDAPAPIAFDARSYDVAFAGSLVNEEVEYERRWRSQKLRARQAFLAEVEGLRDTRPDLSVWLRVVRTHWDGTTAMGSYARALSDARLVLCPRGSSVDTHRYFEALRAGAVPVYEMLPRRDYYDGAPGVRIRDWARLPRVVDALLADRAALLERHRAALAWYDVWVSPPAVAARIARALEQG